MIYLNDHLTDFDMRKALPLLSEQRRTQALRYKHEAGQRQSAAAYLLLCLGLRREYGITTPPHLTYHEGGKPYLTEHPDIHFNLSHCREAAICAIANHPVGVDIESVARYKESVARYTMNDAELEQIQHAPHPEVAFIRLWTMKEALVKLTGEGISHDMKSLLPNADVVFSTHVSTCGRYIYSICEYATDADPTFSTKILEQTQNICEC